MIPATMPRFVRLPGEGARYVSIETILRRFSGLLFPGYVVNGAATFRVLRDSDIEIEEEAEDLVRYFANAIKRRRRGRVIRLELETGMPDELADVLRGELGGADAIITESGNLLGIGDLTMLVDEDRPDLKSRLIPRVSRNVFGSLRATASPQSRPRISSSTIRTRRSRSSSPS